MAIFGEPAQVNLLEEREIIQHFRDLLNFHDLIEYGLQYQIDIFSERLIEVGWSRERITMLIHRACFNTRYEQLINPPLPWRCP